MKLNLSDQLPYLINDKNISCNILSVAEAQNILENTNFYYKITCYKRNFRKDNNNKYIDLDFFHLYDLSIIDMRMRHLFNKLCLDIEHSLKKNLIKDITNSTEDGYAIVNEFDTFEKAKFNLKKQQGKAYGKYKSILKRTIYNVYDPNDYDYQLSKKYFNSTSVPIWVLIEKLTFGQLIDFIEFYVAKQKNNYAYYKTAEELLIMIKRIRNASSHNRPILMNIADKKHSGSLVVSSNVKGFLTKYKINKNVSKKEISLYNNLLGHTKIHDIFCLIILYKEYIESEKMIFARRKEIKSFIHRAKLNKKHYSKHNKMKNIFLFLSKSLNSI
ncbi:Abi-like protein [Enterococcus faecalis 13-SD-W-01]|nr:Abi-like protein [Enterococcus faecalis 13-SD-W-01]